MVGTVRVAHELGMDPNTVSRWATRWHGPAGQGRRRLLDWVDVMVARAWCTPVIGLRPGWRTIAERAIRRQPLRWLLIANDYAETFGEAEHAAGAWWDLNLPCATLIDLGERWPE